MNRNLELNKIYCESNLETMARMPDEFINLTITSPPYDNLRDYNSDFDFDNIAKELYRVTKEGGVVVWNVFDASINGSRTGTSLRQCLKFQEVGFNIHDYMIYEKNSIAFPSKNTSNKYTSIFEFVFILSKGIPKTTKLIIDKRNKYAGCSSYDGKVKEVAEFSPRTTIWKYNTSENDKTKHPAVMPEKMVSDLLWTWSNEGDLVYDCFIGSGTTAKMAHIYNRKWIGSEISQEYVDLANKRLKPYINQTSLF
jgi:DNA modification methylase